jgi:hypothetical protein
LNKIGLSILKVHLGIGAAPYRSSANFNGSGYHHGFAFTEVLRVAKVNDLVEVVELLDVVALATKLTGSMRRTFASIANCLNPNFGHRLRISLSLSLFISCIALPVISLAMAIL